MPVKTSPHNPIRHKNQGRIALVVAIFAAAGVVFIWQSLAATNPNLKGDLNNDNKVNVTDLSILLSNFGKSGDVADLNGDNQVTINDLSILLSNFGKTYDGGTTPPTPTPPTPTPPNPTPPTPTPPNPPAEQTVTIAAAGDIAKGLGPEKATSDMVLNDSSISAVLALGDLAYDNGSDSEYKSKYDPTWGRIKSKTKPTPGNHEYQTSGAKGYFNYFSGVKEYYSFNVGSWHIISLNSNIARTEGSTQMQWLKKDLADNASTKCTLAFWHHPRFSSGDHADDSSVQPFYQALYDANADVILAGHSHLYEKYAPATPTGTKDESRGIRSFVVGTGGADLDKLRSTKGPLEYRNNTVYGLLKLTLSPTGYTWKFVDTKGATPDQGSGVCH